MDCLIEHCHKFLTPDRVKAWLKEQLDRQLKFYNYDTRVRELKDVVEKLNKKGEEIHHKVDEEELRYGREILVDVKKWIERVEQLGIEYETFTGDPYNELAVFDLSKSGGYLPKPGIRYRQSSKAYDITRKANELLQTAATFVDTFSYWSGPPSMAAFFSNLGYESFPSREETMRNIIEELKDPSPRMIGLYGLSGVGKTTLAKQVVKEALRAKMFNVVTMASVTRNPDIRKIQGQIADMLGVTLNEESDIARAARIQKVIKNEKKSMLIILDDLWGKLDLNMLGVPYEMDNHDVLENVTEGQSRSADGLKNDKEEKSTRAHSTMEFKNNLGVSEDTGETEITPTRCKGCKILMISETRQVLSSQMEGKANPIFPLEVLTEKESEMLLKKMAGIGDENTEFEKLAAQIANKCNGLPMSIVKTARALQNQSHSGWENIHQTLEGRNLIGTPQLSTKFIYDHLENDELKYTFLLCARMGRDALIVDLVKFCIGLGFLQGIYSVRETRNKVYALVANLKESGLLSDSYSCDQFTMQDIVRNAALSIAYKENHSFTMTKEKIDEWPAKLERYASISFHHCDFIERFPERINYPSLSVFQVINNDPNLTIPKNFFEGMKELKVLILTGIHMSLSESSISSLEKLRMLCLEQCMLDKELSIIGKLKKLRILSFSGSDIVTLPVELKQLEKLQIFDISNCSKLKEIPSGVISSLVCLEELYMRNTLIQWEDVEPTRQSKIVLLSELKYLNQLTTLDIQIPNVSFLPNNLFFDKLHSYKIVIGDLTAYLETDFKMPKKYETLKFLAIRLKDGFDIHSLTGIKMLFERVENLLLEELKAVQDIFYTLNLKGFSYLKHLLIKNNSTIQSLVQPKDREHPEKAFPKLESLYLYNLENMNKICSCELSKPSFGKLKVIKINLCGQLKNVFSLSVIRLLILLETIEVYECEALKNIVPVERQSNIDEIELLNFPELRFLKLQSLSEFIGLYPIEEKKELFHDKVEVSKIERMELSSIPIDIIWSKLNDQPSSRFSFQNLIHLDVNDCWELEYLISFSMAKSLVSLQNLSVSECEKMRSIFPLKQDSHQIMKGIIFPKLKHIKFHKMKSLSEIWYSKQPLDSFNKLNTLIIEECDKLVNVFPCYKEGMFHNLCNLRVTNCRSMQAIFDLDDKRDLGREYTSNLQDVYLEALPKLEHVWKLNGDRREILNMNTLQKIWVQECRSLEYIFPFSVANKCRHNLEYLVVCDCIKLREIVSKGDAPNTSSDNLDPSFNFLKLSTIKLSALPNLTSFCQGTCGLVFPTLNDLSIELCDKLEPFNKEEPSNDQQRKLVLFDYKVINKLKSMQIESGHAKSPSSYMGKGNHRRDNLEELCLSRLVDTEILYSFLHRNPNLKSLSLNKCSFEEIVPPKTDTKIENIGVVPKLKSLKLVDLPMLKEIHFEPDIILERIEFLILQNCPRMITVVPSSVSLTHLTNLEVVSCEGLENLMSPSTAKSLGQLNTMKVIKCESLIEIVAKGENVGKVVFKQLKALELVSLKNLKSFCSSDSGDFEFTSLEKLVVSACYNMEQFSEKVTSTPILQNIYVVHGKEKKRCYWEGDLNTTIQKISKEKKFFEGMAEMSFSKHPELQQAWQGEVDLQNIHSWFYSLKILRLENCEIQPCAIPSHILPYLKSLKELQVRDCGNVEVVFDMNFTEGVGFGTTFQLQKLTLERLPKLMHVWKSNGKGTKSFQNLQVVSVGECHNLQTVFPAAMAKKLKKLHGLEIKYCDGLLQIIGKEEDTVADVEQMFEFPCLMTLVLQCLSELICFYPESFTLEYPLLNTLNVFNCPKFELFESANRQPFFVDLNDISNLEYLLLEWKHMYSLVLKSRSGELAGCLEYLNDINLCFYVGDENEEPILPIEILQRAPNLITMTIYYCHCLEVFHIQIPKIEENRMLEHLKVLTLRCVSKLQWIGSEDSPWLNVICDKLHGFNAYDCPDLTTLVHSPSAVSFSNLKELYISECHGLEYLFTSSAANKLIHLEHIVVWECKSIKKIVAKDQNETTSGGIKLERLYHIDLYILSSLECFYSGNETLHLPSLMQVEIQKCPNMEFFSRGLISANSFRGIKASYDSNDELVMSNDINSSVKEVFLREGFLKAVDDEYFAESVLGKVGLQNKWLRNLVTLNLRNCTLLYAIPSVILACLKNLEELEVRDSEKVEVIFDMNDAEVMETPSQLKKLTLRQLSNLVNVWEKNSHEVLIFQNLQEVIVSGCKNLQTLFPASHAKNLKKLEKLDIHSCDKLQEIVEKEESTEAGATENSCDLTTLVHTMSLSCLEKVSISKCPQLQCLFTSSTAKKLMNIEEITVKECESMKEIVAKEGGATNEVIQFEQLKTIVLHSLPSLVYFFSGSDTLQLTSLIDVHVWECPNMTIFSKGLVHVQADEDAEGEFRQAFFKAVDKDCFSDNLELQEDWHDKVDLQNTWLCNLTTLKLDKCVLSYAIPSAILLRLKNLQELEVRDSDKVKAIFDTSNSETMETSQLKKLTLLRLSNLVHVWQRNSKGVLIFQNLQEVIVSRCENLQALFPASLAKNLEKLETLQLEYCDKFKEIVEKEESTASGVTEKFVFPCLEKLYIYDLPRITNFYPETFTVECPSLNSLYVLDCYNFELIQSTSINRQPLISKLKVISKLKELRLDWKHISASTLRFRSETFAEGLNYLKEISLFFDADENEKVMLPIEILQKAPNVIRMNINFCKDPEILFAQNPKIGEDGILGQLKILQLWKVSALQSIEFKDSSWLNTICEKLHELYVDQCPHLTSLAHTMSFSCLKQLSINNCPQLQYLFTYSAAKKLMNLEEITVKECESMKEIVAKAGEEGDEDEGEDKYGNEMILGKLQFLKLYSLPKFESFYMGSSTLNFLSLKEVWFYQCCSTKLFRHHDKLPVNLKVAIDGLYKEGDIHSVITQQLEDEAA